MTVKIKDNAEVARTCPACGPTAKLRVRTNHQTGQQFLGCPNYPDCMYTEKIPESLIMEAQGQKKMF